MATTRVIALLGGAATTENGDLTMGYSIHATDGVTQFNSGISVVVPVGTNVNHLNDIILQAIIERVGSGYPTSPGSIAPPDSSDIFFTHVERG